MTQILQVVAVCAGSFDPRVAQRSGQFTPENIAMLKKALQEQIAQLDEMARSVGSPAGEKIDPREKPRGGKGPRKT
jgi:hypothetical protein